MKEQSEALNQQQTAGADSNGESTDADSRMIRQLPVDAPETRQVTSSCHGGSLQAESDNTGLGAVIYGQKNRLPQPERSWSASGKHLHTLNVHILFYTLMHMRLSRFSYINLLEYSFSVLPSLIWSLQSVCGGQRKKRKERSWLGLTQSSRTCKGNSPQML